MQLPIQSLFRRIFESVHGDFWTLTATTVVVVVMISTTTTTVVAVKVQKSLWTFFD